MFLSFVDPLLVRRHVGDRTVGWAEVDRLLHRRAIQAGGFFSPTSPIGAEFGAQLGSVRGSPKRGRTLLSKRVMAQMRPPDRVRTSSPSAWHIPVCESRT